MSDKRDKDEPAVVPSPVGKMQPPDDSTVVWQKLDLLGDRLAVVSERTAEVKSSLSDVNRRFDAIDKLLEKTDSKVSGLNDEVKSAKAWVLGAAAVVGLVVFVVAGALAMWVWPHIQLLWVNKP